MLFTSQFLADLSKRKETLPLLGNDDISLHEWFMTIEDVKCRTVDGIKEYYVAQVADNKRKIESPCREEDSPPAKRHMPKPNLRPNLQSYRSSRKTSCERTTPSIYDVELIGDDQFLNLAVFDLDYERKPLEPRRQSGNCVSGLRIREATMRIYNMEQRQERRESEPAKRIVVNVGSVDIAEGRMLIEMMKDMDLFLEACFEMNIIPILTTLAPLPYYEDNGLKNTILNDFNRYICRYLVNDCNVIDLNKCMVKSNGKINHALYQPEKRYLSGSQKPFFMWNKQGRNRVYNMLRRNLGHALVYNRNFIGGYV